MAVSSLLDQVKAEARVKGSDNLDTMIMDIINELLLEETENHRYSQLLLRNVPITLIAATGTYALPVNFQNIRRVRYNFQSGYSITLNERNGYVQERAHGSPKYFEIGAGNLYFFPFDTVRTADSLLIDYYKVPDILTSGSAFPIPKLFGPIKQKAIWRVLLYNRDLAEAQVFAGAGAEDTERAQNG